MWPTVPQFQQWRLSVVKGFSKRFPAAAANEPAEAAVAAFRAAFATLGYVDCKAADLEAGFERIAVFARDGIPTHATRQLPDGLWTSKVGELEDIEHNLHDLEGDAYGTVALLMMRPK